MIIEMTYYSLPWFNRLASRSPLKCLLDTMIIVCSILVFFYYKENVSNIFIKYTFAIDFDKYILSDKGSSVPSLGTYNLSRFGIFFMRKYFFLHH